MDIEECSICLSPLDGTITTVGCCKKQSHMVCLLKCIDRKNECPLCRKQNIIEHERNEHIIIVRVEPVTAQDVRVKRCLCVVYSCAIVAAICVISVYKNFAPW